MKEQPRKTVMKEQSRKTGYEKTDPFAWCEARWGLGGGAGPPPHLIS